MKKHYEIFAWNSKKNIYCKIEIVANNEWQAVKKLNRVFYPTFESVYCVEEDKCYTKFENI